MAEYDGSIRIGTEITTKNAEKELKGLKSSVSKTADEIASLRSKMDSLKDVKIPTDEYKAIQNQIDVTEKKINDLQERQKKFLATGGKESSSTYKKMQYDIDELRESLPYLKGELQDLVETGKSFTLGSDTEKYAKMSAQMQKFNQQMESDTQRQSELQSQLSAEEERLSQIREKSVVGNQHIVQTLEQIKQLEQEIADLKSAGVTEGYKDYDERIRKLSQLKREVEDYNSDIRNTKEDYKKLGDAGKESAEKINKSQNNVSESLSRIKISLSGIIGSLARVIGAIGIVSLGEQAIDTASDIREVQNVVDTAFGSMSYKIEEFSSTAVKQFGMSRLSAKQTGSTFMAMGSSMVDSMEQASDMAIALTARSADMASFFNKSADETATALKSIYTGETETLKEYGVVMTEVNLQEYAAEQGITKKLSAMTQAEKVQLRYNYVMEQTALAAGDFAKTSGSWANQTRILSEQFKELLSVLGSGLITVLTPAVQVLNTILTQLIAMATQLGGILSKLFGISVPVATAAKGISDMSSGASGIGAGLEDASKGADDLAKKTKKAGKEANKSLSAFDKLTVLSDSKDSGKDSGGTGNLGVPGFQMPQVDTENYEAADGVLSDILGKLHPILDYLKEIAGITIDGFWDGLGDWKSRIASIKESFTSIKDNLKDIFTDPGVLNAADGFVKSTANLLGTLAGSAASIGLTIATNLVGGMEKYLEENKERIKKYLIDMFDIWSDIETLLAEFFSSFAYVFEAFASENGQKLTAELIGIFSSAFQGITTLASKVIRDILNILIQPFVDNKEKFRTALEGFLGVVAEVAGTIKETIDHTFDKINEVYDEHFKPFFDSIADGLSELTGKFLDFWNEDVQPILEKWANKFDTLMKEHIQPFIDNVIELWGDVADLLKEFWEHLLQPFIGWIIENILPNILPVLDTIFDVVSKVIGDVADIFSGVVDTIRGAIQLITALIKGDWEGAWDAAGKIVSGIFNTIKSKIKLSVDAVLGIIKIFLEKTKAIWDSTFGLLLKKVSEIFNSVLSTISGKIGSAKEKISSVLGNIKSNWDSVWSGLKTKVSNIFNSVGTAVSGGVNSVKSKISSGLKNIKKIWDDIWGGFQKTVTNIFNAIKNTVKSAVDSVLSFIKPLTSAVSKVGSAVSNLLGFGKSSKSSSSSSKGRSASPYTVHSVMAAAEKAGIPAYAGGAVFPGGNPYLALVNDQPRGQTNIEAPLTTMVQAFKQALAESGQSGKYTFVAQLNGKTIFDEVVRQDQIYTNKTGHGRFEH